MTAASALPLDIPRVQKDASLHPRSFFSFFPRPGHSLPKAASATSFSTLRQRVVGSLGPLQPPLWQLRCRTGGSRQRPPVPYPSGVSAPFLLLLSWSPCSLGAALQQQEEAGRPWNTVGGMFCEVWRKSFLIGKKEKKKIILLSQTCWLLQLLLCYLFWSPYLQGTSFHFSDQCRKRQSSHYLVLTDTLENSKGALELGIPLICRNKLLPVNS